MNEFLPKVNLEIFGRLENSSDINNIDFQNFDSFIGIEFTFGDQKEKIVFEFYNVIQFSFSKEPDDEKTFVVLGVSLYALHDKDHREYILKKLAFSYIDKEGVVATYLDRELFYFCVEGGICIDIIFESYKFRSENWSGK